MKYLRISLAATVALLLLASCGTIGDVLGTGNNYPNTSNQSLSGTVNYIDTSARRIDLNANGYTNTVYYDSRTQFIYQNQNVNANAIRSGDYVTIQAYNSNNGQLIASTVTDTGSGMASGTYPSNTYPNTNGTFEIQGTVNYVDTSAQRIDISSAYVTGLRTGAGQGTYSVYYDSRTPVYFQNRSYSPSALERGDQIDVRAFDNGNGRYTASTITVTRNVRQ